MKELQANREAAALERPLERPLERLGRDGPPKVDPRYRRAVDAAVMIVKHERGTKEVAETRAECGQGGRDWTWIDGLMCSHDDDDV